MNQIKFIYFALILMVGISMTSCKKDNPSPITKTEILTSTPWKYSSATYTGTGFDSIYGAAMDLLYGGTTINFASDKTYTMVYAGGTISDTWSFNADETMITINNTDGNGGSWVGTINVLNDTDFKFTQALGAGSVQYAFIK